MHSPHPSFGIYTENLFPHPHKLQAWCPTADLLALVSHENDLEMYRLSWEKHWSIRVKAPPKQTGGVSRLSGPGDADVVSLAWRPDESSTQQEMSARMMFAKHRRGAAARGGFGGATRTVAGTALGLSKAEDVTVLDEESSPIMNALFSSDNQGRFKLRLFGGFDMESISLKDMLQKFGPHQFQTIDILAADIQADLSELAIIALGSTSEAKSTGGQLLQITVGSGLLRGHAREIRALGVRARPVQHLLTYMDECLEVMKKDYGKLAQLAENSVESLKECLNNNGESSDPTTEFSQLLLTGRPSVSMDQYLQQELGHHGVMRWDKSGKAAYENMRKVAFECLLPACERLVVHMTDILAYSRWRERYGPLDLDESKVYSCIRLAGEFIGMIERLFQALKVEIKQFNEFENWLEQAVEKLQPIARGADEQDEGPKKFPPVDTLSVAGYLKSGMGKGLADFFKESEATLEERVDQSTVPLDTVPSYPIVYPFAQELRELTTVPERDLPRVPSGLGLVGASEPSAKQVSTMTIEGHLKQLIHQCHLVFEGPSLTLARSFKVLHLLNLTPLDPAPLSSNFQAQSDIKVSLRYCYQDLEPWLSRKSEQPSSETPHSSEQDRMLLNPLETRSGRKRKSSDEYVDSRKETRTGASLLSPGTVSKEFSSLSLVSTPRMGLNTTDATRVEMSIARYTEATLFSLRVDGLPSLEGHEVEGYQEPAKRVDIRDIVFRDHDSLALLLSSPDTDQLGYMDQQYLVLMPLDPHKYTPDILSDAIGASLLDRLTVANPSSEILALPIIMSRNVTQLSMMDTSFASTSLISHGVPDDTLDKTNTLVGPCRIACNERGKSQVLSIHGPLQPGAQGAGRITIFDL
ncbi:Anaphase-promoting complex subunit 4 [Mortierella antarctica]|nr:Anaphase-promoting complex subunit 4 [Mortierella antarctica]